ncbi:MAG: alpha/beta hydrolase [Alphaproteobacteria bacterium]
MTLQPAPKTLSRPNGGAIAYHAHPGDTPGVMFCGGFMSEMTGDKALAFEEFCTARGQAFVRFDYSGHGASAGELTDGTIGSWADDAIAILDDVATGPQILVGSSMGGWLMLLAALARPGRMAGLIGISSAPDFTENLIWRHLDGDERVTLARDGVIYQANEYGDEPYAITMGLIEDGRKHLLLASPISITCPVRLFHGMADRDVPWRVSAKLARRLETDDVAVTLVKDANHRFSRRQDIARICQAIDELSQPRPAAGD